MRSPGEASTDRRPRPAWLEREPGRLIGRGHRAGDLLRADRWEVLEAEAGFLRVEAELPDTVLNPRGMLFGGFTGTYADLMAIFTARGGPEYRHFEGWLATSDLKIDYLEPVRGPRFRLEGEVIHRGRRSHLVHVRFLDLEGRLLALSQVRMVEVGFP